MKKLKKILTIVLVLIISLTLFACEGAILGFGGKSGKVSKSGCSRSKSSSTKAEQMEKDESLLKSNGYTVYSYSSHLEKYDENFNVPSGSLIGLINASNSDQGTAVTIYYFKNSSLAEQAFKNIRTSVTSAYKLRGNRIFLSDTTGLFN